MLYLFTDPIFAIAVIVMAWLTNHDPDHKKKDDDRLQLIRHISFVVMASVLLADWAAGHTEFTKDLIIWSGEAAVVINVAALYLRKHPGDGLKIFADNHYYVHRYSFFPLSFIASFFKGKPEIQPSRRDIVRRRRAL